jgi:hypothetical protein
VCFLTCHPPAPLIPLPFTCNWSRAHRFAPTTVICGKSCPFLAATPWRRMIIWRSLYVTSIPRKETGTHRTRGRGPPLTAAQLSGLVTPLTEPSAIITNSMRRNIVFHEVRQVPEHLATAPAWWNNLSFPVNETSHSFKVSLPARHRRATQQFRNLRHAKSCNISKLCA